MSDSFISAAFFQVCREAKEIEKHFVSLYVKTPYYGGPEEGGWWGTNHDLVAYQEFPTFELAERAKDDILTLTQELNIEACKDFGKQCLRELEWLEARGLDSDFLPEVDGESEYYVVIEEIPGSHRSRGCRHYE